MADEWRGGNNWWRMSGGAKGLCVGGMCGSMRGRYAWGLCVGVEVGSFGEKALLFTEDNTQLAEILDVALHRPFGNGEFGSYLERLLLDESVGQRLKEEPLSVAEHIIPRGGIVIDFGYGANSHHQVVVMNKGVVDELIGEGKDREEIVLVADKLGRDWVVGIAVNQTADREDHHYAETDIAETFHDGVDMVDSLLRAISPFGDFLIDFGIGIEMGHEGLVLFV